MNEQEIIKGLLEKDEKAFREVVETFRKNVYHTCFGFVHNKQDAEDIAQDVFIELYRSVTKFRGDSKLSTWVYRICVNKSLNHIRKHKNSKLLLPIEMLFSGVKDDENRTEITEPSTPENSFEHKEMKKVLHQAIDSLPENQRTAFTLSKFEDLSYIETAKVMETSLSAVESLIHRAKLGLQKKLLKYKKSSL
ncbi:MAG: sigma-70 family RNA polymerase sigma factor [Bacteroidota bacterium]